MDTESLPILNETGSEVDAAQSLFVEVVTPASDLIEEQSIVDESTAVRNSTVEEVMSMSEILGKPLVLMPHLNHNVNYAFSVFIPPLPKPPDLTHNAIANPPLPPEPPDNVSLPTLIVLMNEAFPSFSTTLDAYILFVYLPHRNKITWSYTSSMYAQHSFNILGLVLFFHFLRSYSMNPTEFILDHGTKVGIQWGGINHFILLYGMVVKSFQHVCGGTLLIDYFWVDYSCSNESNLPLASHVTKTIVVWPTNSSQGKLRHGCVLWLAIDIVVSMIDASISHYCEMTLEMNLFLAKEWIIDRLANTYHIFHHNFVVANLYATHCITLVPSTQASHFVKVIFSKIMYRRPSNDLSFEPFVITFGLNKLAEVADYSYSSTIIVFSFGYHVWINGYGLQIYTKNVTILLLLVLLPTLYDSRGICATSYPSIILPVVSFNATQGNKMKHILFTKAQTMYDEELIGLPFWSLILNVCGHPRYPEDTPIEDPWQASQYFVQYIPGLQQVIFGLWNSKLDGGYVGIIQTLTGLRKLFSNAIVKIFFFSIHTRVVYAVGTGVIINNSYDVVCWFRTSWNAHIILQSIEGAPFFSPFGMRSNNNLKNTDRLVNGNGLKMQTLVDVIVFNRMNNWIGSYFRGCSLLMLTTKEVNAFICEFPIFRTVEYKLWDPGGCKNEGNNSVKIINLMDVKALQDIHSVNSSVYYLSHIARSLQCKQWDPGKLFIFSWQGKVGLWFILEDILDFLKTGVSHILEDKVGFEGDGIVMRQNKGKGLETYESAKEEWRVPQETKECHFVKRDANY
jgi:hypothetical protein